jgi:hypothetical protein
MKSDKDEITIGISKIKSSILVFIGTGLFSVSIWALTKILIMPSGFDKIFLITLISLLTIVFGLSCISGFKKFIDNKQGLIVNDKGININIGPNRGQFISWNEVKEIKFQNQVGGNMYLLFFVKNPTDILKKAKGLNRLFLKMNNISHKTPVSITSTWLELNLFEIMEIIEEKMEINRIAMRQS